MRHGQNNPKHSTHHVDGLSVEKRTNFHSCFIYIPPSLAAPQCLHAASRWAWMELWHRPPIPGATEPRSLACGLPSILEAHTPADLKHKPWVTPSRFLRQRGMVGSTPLLPPIGSAVARVRPKNRHQPNSTTTTTTAQQHPARYCNNLTLAKRRASHVCLHDPLCGIRGPGRISRCCYGDARAHQGTHPTRNRSSKEGFACESLPP